MVTIVQAAHFTRSVAKAEENENTSNGAENKSKILLSQSGLNILEDVGYRQKKKQKKLERKDITTFCCKDRGKLCQSTGIV